MWWRWCFKAHNRFILSCFALRAMTCLGVFISTHFCFVRTHPMKKQDTEQRHSNQRYWNHHPLQTFISTIFTSANGENAGEGFDLSTPSLSHHTHTKKELYAGLSFTSQVSTRCHLKHFPNHHTSSCLISHKSKPLQFQWFSQTAKHFSLRY